MVSKILFYDLNQFTAKSNIKINYSPIQEEGIVLTNTELYEGCDNNYYTFIQDPNDSNIVFACYRSSKTNDYKDIITGKTCIALSNDGGLTFEKILNEENNNIILKDKCICYNFTPFYDPIDEQIKGIGGNQVNMYNADNINPMIKEEHVKDIILSVPYEMKTGEMGIKTKKLQIPNILTEFESNGIYLYECTNNYFGWDRLIDRPIIHGLSKGQTDKVDGYTKFDSSISIFYHPFHQKYFFYVKSDIGKCHTFFQYTSSDNLLDWEEFKLINLDPYPVKKRSYQDNDNYYYSNINPYPNSKFFIGFPAYFNYRAWKSGIYVIISEDGYNFKRLNQTMKTSMNLVNSKMYNGQLVRKYQPKIFSCNGLIISNDQTKFYLYLQHNNKDINNMICPDIIRYSIRIDGFTSIICQDDNQTGEFDLSIPSEWNNKTNLYLNFRTLSEGGYIKINQVETTINGDDCNYNFSISPMIENSTIKITIYKAELFSLSA